MPLGAPSIKSEPSHVSGLVPQSPPNESRYALRFLREGYVYVYIEKTPAGFSYGNWLVYRVCENGDILSQSNPLFDMHPYKPCGRKEEHNTQGMKVLTLPEAHLLMGSTLWIAYSPNFWSDNLKSQNAANKEVMQKIILGGKNDNTFKPTEKALKAHILECKIRLLNINGAVTHDIPFNSQVVEVDKLAKVLEAAAAASETTKGHELALVLADPIGLAIEFNALRLYRYAQAGAAVQAEAEKPENAWNLKSSETLLALKDLYERVSFAKALDECAPVMTHAEFYSKPIPTNPFFPATSVGMQQVSRGVWEPIEFGTERDDTLGRNWQPGKEQEVLKRADKAAKEGWEKITNAYIEIGDAKKPGRKDSIEQFHKEMRKSHFDPVASYERDWWMACQDIRFKNVFSLHFDATDPNRPTCKVSPGKIYAGQAYCSLTPQPYIDEAVQQAYVAMVTADIKNKQSVILRALAANQSDIIEKIDAVFMVGNQSTNPEEGLKNLGERNDKLYDLGGGLIKSLAEKKPSAKYAWMVGALVDVMGAYTLGFAHSAAAAVTALAAKQGGAAFMKSEAGKIAMGRMSNILLVQRTLDLVSRSIVKQGLVEIPLQITKRFPSGQGIYLLSQMGFTKSQSAGLIHGGFMDVTLTTSNLKMAGSNYQVDDAIASGKGTVSGKGKPAAALLMPLIAAHSIRLTDSQFAAIFKEGVNLETARKLMKALPQGADNAFNSLDGRLALGGVVLNAIQMMGNIKTLWEKDDPIERRNAWFGLTDASSGVLGAASEMIAEGIRGRIEYTAGKAAAEHSLSVVTWRGIGFAMGALAGGVNGTLNLIKAGDAGDAEQPLVSTMFYASSIAFYGTLGSGLALTVGALARRMIIKGALQTAVVRLGAQFATEAAVASLSGWGLLLLGAAVLFELGAVLLTPTEMQVWARKSRFGTNSRDKFANAKEEWEALQKLLAPKEESKPSSGQVAAKRALILPPVGLAVPLFAEILVEYWLDQQKVKAKSGTSAK